MDKPKIKNFLKKGGKGFFSYLRHLLKFHTEKSKQHKIKILIPPELRNVEDGGCRGYSKLKKTYHNYKLKSYINDKKVRYWKLVYTADDPEGDEYIPIFQNPRRKK